MQPIDVVEPEDPVPGYEASAWFGMAVPKGTPRPIIVSSIVWSTKRSRIRQCRQSSPTSAAF
jgi:hypothetical protein